MRARYAVLCVAAIAAVTVAVPAAAAAESMSAHVTTPHPTVGQQLTVTGTLSGAATYPETITMTREDSTGTTQMPVDSQMTQDAQGDFTLHDTPPARGSVTYHLSADDGTQTDVTTTVAGKQPDLTIHVTPSPANSGSSAHVVAHLGPGTTNRELTLSLRPYQGSKQEFDSGPVDANGDRVADHAVQQRTTFFATFGGDSAYAPATVQTTLRVRAVLDEALKGWYRSSGSTRIYHHKNNPSLAVHMLPENKGDCLYFRAQHRSHGKWVRSAVSTCVKTDGTGRAIGVLTGDHIVGVPYRLRAEWRGNNAVAARKGIWMHLQFR